MMKGVTVSQLSDKIFDNVSSKRDMIASTQDLTLTPDLKLSVKDVGSYPILETAHDQIGARLNIPAKYYDRMRAEQPGLLALNVNTWMTAKPEKRMLRTLRGNLRAFLSNSYQRIENEEIAAVAFPILREIPDVQFVSCELTERRMYIQAVCPRVRGEVALNDVVQAGVIISNSEIGHGAVSVAPTVWRLRCLNGMVCPDKFRAYHVGRAVQDSEALWADDTKKADDRAVLLKVRDMVRSAVNETAFQARVGKMQGLVEQRIESDVAKSVEVLGNKINATDTERAGMLRALIEGGDISAWGLVNAVTAQAHTAKDYDRAVELEAIGGRLVELGAGEWREVLAAK